MSTFLSLFPIELLEPRKFWYKCRHYVYISVPFPPQNSSIPQFKLRVGITFTFLFLLPAEFLIYNRTIPAKCCHYVYISHFSPAEFLKTGRFRQNAGITYKFLTFPPQNSSKLDCKMPTLHLHFCLIFLQNSSKPDNSGQMPA